MQNTLPLHKALPPSNAKYGPNTCLPTTSYVARVGHISNMDTIPDGLLRLGILVALVHADNLEGPILGW